MSADLKRLLALGIADQSARVVAWMAGCATLSLATLLAGATGCVAVAIIFLYIVLRLAAS